MSRYYSGGRPRGRAGYYRGGSGGSSAFYEGGQSRFYTKERRDYGDSGVIPTDTRAQLEIAKKLVDTLMHSGGGGSSHPRRSSGGDYLSSGGSYKRPREDIFDRPERRYSDGYHRRSIEEHHGPSGDYRPQRYSDGGSRGFRTPMRRGFRTRGYVYRGGVSTRGGYRGTEAFSEERPRYNSNPSYEGNRSFSGAVPKSYMTLRCPHCKLRCATFSAYRQHQLGREHMAAMRRVMSRVRTELTRMRLAQREVQQELEKKQAEKDIDYDTKEPAFCAVCKLQYREVDGVVHEETEWHKKQKSYHNPTCALCGNNFPTRISYEKHLGSLNHLQKQHQSENSVEKSDAVAFKKGDMMTLDEVGDVDGGDENAEEQADSSEPKIPASQKLAELGDYDGKHALGSSYMRKTEVYHCGLCDIYIKITNKINAVLIKHCMGKKHFENYRKKLTKLAEKEVEDKKAAAAAQKAKTAAAAAVDAEKADADAEDGDGEKSETPTNGESTRVVRKTNNKSEEPAAWDQMDDNFILGDDQDDVKEDDE